jgi:glutaminyl-peptide cyclotransferase
MEYIDGFIYANVWQTDCLAIIDPGTGTVVSWALMQSLTALAESTAGKPFSDGMEELNGIAWDQAGRRLFVTGKWWPRVYQVRLEEGLGPIGTPQTVASARESCIPT